MIRIFLSYAREDYAAVKKLYERLKVAGYQPWMDKVDLLKGDDFTKAIPKVIRETDFFIVCMSTRSVVKRSFVQREIKLALDLFQDKLSSDLFIFPVRLEECETPDHISNFNRTDLFGDEADDEWEALLRSLHEGARRLGKPLITAKVVEEKKIIAPRFESYTEDLGNGVKLEMVAIPGGTFLMGDSEAEKVFDNEVGLQGFLTDRLTLWVFIIDHDFRLRLVVIRNRIWESVDGKCQNRGRGFYERTRLAVGRMYTFWNVKLVELSTRFFIIFHSDLSRFVLRPQLGPQRLVDDKSLNFSKVSSHTHLVSVSV